MDDSVKTIAANVRRLRAARGLSAAGLARASGVARATLAELEAGRGNPTVETLYGLASVLGVTLADLLVAAEAPAVQVVRAGEGPHVSGPVLEARLLRQASVDRARVELYELHVLPGRPRRGGPPPPPGGGPPGGGAPPPARRSLMVPAPRPHVPTVRLRRRPYRMTVIVKVCGALVSLPPLAVPPSSTARTVIVAEPIPSSTVS